VVYYRIFPENQFLKQQHEMAKSGSPVKKTIWLVLMYRKGTVFVKRTVVQEKILAKDQIRLEQLATHEDDKGRFISHGNKKFQSGEIFFFPKILKKRSIFLRRRAAE